MQRDADISGVSGVGVVAQGVVFDDGTTVIRWHGEHCSTAVWDTLVDAIEIHGHNGATRFIFDDERYSDSDE